MVTLNMQYNENMPKEIWWAYSAELGWVAQDRELFVNRCWDFPEEMTFVRCNDLKEFTQGERKWDYKEASRYLEGLSQSEALEKINELKECQARYLSQLEQAA